MESLIAIVVNALVGPIADKVLEWHKNDNLTSINRQQLETELKKVGIQSATDAYKSGTDAAWRTFDSFHQTLRTSKAVRRVWSIAVYSQLLFVIYLEIGVPALVGLGIIDSWKVGSLDTWALGFLGASLGISPIVMKTPTPPVV